MLQNNNVEKRKEYLFVKMGIPFLKRLFVCSLYIDSGNPLVLISSDDYRKPMSGFTVVFLVIHE